MPSTKCALSYGSKQINTTSYDKYLDRIQKRNQNCDIATHTYSQTAIKSLNYFIGSKLIWKSQNKG